MITKGVNFPCGMTVVMLSVIRIITAVMVLNPFTAKYDSSRFNVLLPG